MRSLMHLGIDVVCAERRNVLTVDYLERLSEKLPMLYFRPTA